MYYYYLVLSTVFKKIFRLTLLRNIILIKEGIGSRVEIFHRRFDVWQYLKYIYLKKNGHYQINVGIYDIILKQTDTPLYVGTVAYT